MLPALGRRLRTSRLSGLRRCAHDPLARPSRPARCGRHFASSTSTSPPLDTRKVTDSAVASAASHSSASSPASSSSQSALSSSSTAAGYDAGLDVQPAVSWAASDAAAAPCASSAAQPIPPPSAAPFSRPSLSPPSTAAALPSLPRPARRAPKGGVEFFVDIDEHGLLAHPEQPYVDPTQNAAKGRLTPLSAELHEQMKVRGPLTVSDFMYQCAQNPRHGYYTAKKDVIGGKADAGSGPVGDFITSPEISQLFGELLGVWMVDCWHKLGKPPSFALVELGPGRGTLMRDMLRTIRHWPAMHSALEVHMVETSPLMREEQRGMLGVALQQDGRAPFFSVASAPSAASAASSSASAASSTTPSTLILPPGYIPPRSASAASSASASAAASNITAPASSPAQFGDLLMSGFTRDRVRVTWHSSLASLPTSRPVLFVGHEFLDALPVHHFVYRKERGWSEVLVDADYSTSSPHHFRFVLSPAATPASSAFIGDRRGDENDMVEVQAASAAIVEDVTHRIGRQTGAALFIDYGSTQPSQPSLQAVQSHQHVHPLHEPGLTDLTTLVHFDAMAASADRAAAMGAHDVFSLPVISQHSFLRNMNIARRLSMLVDAVWDRVGQRSDQAVVALSEDEAERTTDELVQAATRLVSEDGEAGGMGGLFKVLGIVHSKMGTEIAAWNEAEVRDKRQKDKANRAESDAQTLTTSKVSTSLRRHRNE